MASTGPVYHIVLFKYRTDINWADFEAHFEILQALQQKCLHPVTSKPYMRSMKVGKNRTWEQHHKDFTHAIILEFDPQADLDYYLTKDPVHLDFCARDRLIVKDVVVADIVNGVLFGPRAEKPGGTNGSYKGSCHCKSMAWEVISEEPMKHVLCHCDTCKKLGGGPDSCNYIVPQEALKITRGTPGCYTYQGASGKDIRCFFCPNCTSHIYHHQDAMPDKVIVRTLLLEGGNDLEAGGEIFPEGKLKWAEDLRQSLGVPETKGKVNGIDGA